MADAIKKGSLIRVNREAYIDSLEAKASAGDPPAYLLEGRGLTSAGLGFHAAEVSLAVNADQASFFEGIGHG